MRNTEALEKMSFAKPVVFFDGVCVLCNHSVQFLLRHNPKKICTLLRFKRQYLAPSKELESIVVLKNGQYYTSFIAIGKLLPHLSVSYRIMGSILYLCPPFVGHFFYKKIAQNRYLWFEKRTNVYFQIRKKKIAFKLLIVWGNGRPNF